MEVIESYMRLNLKEETSYLVERSEILRRLPNVMACECVTLMNDRLCLIEAKSSAPAPRNKEDFNGFIGDISQKFTDTLLFFNALCLNRHESKSVNESALKRLLWGACCAPTFTLSLLMDCSSCWILLDSVCD